MRHVSFVALALLALSGAGSSAAAQQVPSPYRYVEATQSAGVFGGYLFTDRGELGIGPHSGPLAGALYTIRFSGPLSGEVGVAGMPSERTVFQRVAVSSDSSAMQPLGDVSAFVLTAHAGLRFHLTGPRTWRGLAPFVAANGGVVADLRGQTELDEALASSQRVDFGPAFAVGLGAGTDWFLTERLTLRLEVQDRVWRLTAPEGLSGTGTRESEWIHNFGVTLGSALYF